MAGYHLGYAGEPREVEITAEQERTNGALTRWLTNQLGRDITIPDLSDAGLTFAGGRLFFVNGEPVGQIAYHDRQGRLTGFCIKQSATSGDAPLTREQLGDDLEMVTWQAQGYQYALVGFEEFDVLKPIADRLEERYGTKI